MEETQPVPDTVPEQKKRTVKQEIFEIVKFTVIALIIVVPLRMFVAQPFVVSGESMVPTFEHGDYLIIDEISYRFNEPERGDVVVFKYPLQPDRFFIKRVIGLPHETIQIRAGEITIINEEFPEGFTLTEDYLDVTTEGAVNTELGNDEYFVMGDNRDASSDSRFWGALPKDFIVGRALVRLLPFKDIGVMPGSVDLPEPTNE